MGKGHRKGWKKKQLKNISRTVESVDKKSEESRRKTSESSIESNMSGNSRPESEAEHRHVESRALAFLRNPVVIGLAVLATIATAFQVAGVTSMLLVKLILAGGVWIFVTTEVGFSKWIRKTGLYASSIILLTSMLSGIAAVKMCETISVLKQQQAHLQQPDSPTTARSSVITAPGYLGSRGDNLLSNEILKELRELRTRQDEATIKPKLSMLASIAMAGSNQSSGLFWISHQSSQGPIVSVANIAVFIGVINNTKEYSMITSYYGEVRHKDGLWVRLDSISTIGGNIYFGVSPQSALPANNNPIFDRAMLQHTIQEGEIITGWVFFRFPTTFSGIEKDSQVRITLKDINGFIVRGEVRVEEGGQPALLNLNAPAVDLRPFLHAETNTQH